MILDWLNSPLGVWPWAERNQGFLSVTALVIALAIAVYEVKRAARSESRTLVDYIDWVLNCADKSLELTYDAIRTIDGKVNKIDAMRIPTWRVLNGNAVSTLEEIQSLRPTHPRLAHYVNRLLRTMQMEVEGNEPTTQARYDLEAVYDYVLIMREHIADMRPMRDRDKLVAFIRRILRFRPATPRHGWRPPTR